MAVSAPFSSPASSLKGKVSSSAASGLCEGYSQPKQFPHDYFYSKHFEAWVKLHRPQLLSLARKWVGSAEADDCLQNAVITTWQSLARLPEQCLLSEFLKFFYSRLRQACRNHLRQQVSQQEVSYDVSVVLLLAEDIAEGSSLALADLTPDCVEAMKGHLLTLLHRATLTALQETCIRQWLDGWSQVEIAEYLTISQSAVSAHIKRGVKKLREGLHPEDLEPESTAEECFFETIAQIKASMPHKRSKSRPVGKTRHTKAEAR